MSAQRGLVDCDSVSGVGSCCSNEIIENRRDVLFLQIDRVGSSPREGVSWSEELSKVIVSALNPNKFLNQPA
jgi:hypothetical protein